MELTPFIKAYLLVVSVILGSVMGSFLNCTAIRIVRRESFVKGRSHCMSCGHTLSPLDLVPIFSFIFLRGKCRYCGAKLNPRYLIAELLGAGTYFVTVLCLGFSLQTLELLILSSIMLCITFADLEDFIIPDGLVLAGIICRIPFVLLSGSVGKTALSSLLGGVCVAVPLLLIALLMDKLLKKESMGGGDIKLFFMVGLYLGWQRTLVALLFACISGILFGVIYKAKASKAENNVEDEEVPAGAFPFGPSIALGAYLSYLMGNALLSFYIGLF